MATAGQAAAHLDLNERSFYRLIEAGTIERKPAGGYDLDEVRLSYIRHMREVAAGRTSEGGDLDLAAERARLAKAQADSQEMKNAVARGDLLPADQVKLAVTKMVMNCRTRLLSLPSKLAPLVIGMTAIASVKDVLQDGVHEALDELSETSVVGVPGPEQGGPSGDGLPAGLLSDLEVPAQADGKPVGRPRKAAQSGGKRGTRKVGHRAS